MRVACRAASFASLYASISLKEQIKSTKNFHDNRSLGQDLKPVPSEYKARVLKA
jgi:hypothetical protein